MTLRGKVASAAKAVLARERLESADDVMVILR
jgi:hypothetical protein